MRAWQEDQLHALSAVECEHALFEIIVSLARDLGFDYCAYGLRMPLPLIQPRMAMFNNYPIGWQQKYQEKNYLAVDPTVQHGIRSLLPIIWSDSLFAPAPELWEEARSFGLQIGWAQASRDVNSASGLLTLARSGEPISEAELQDKELKMMWLAQAAHLRMSRLLVTKMLPETRVQLSSRETEVLKWTGDGKTSAEISEILNISERTVNFHISNAMIKLNAANKAAAVVRAAILGMLA